MYVKYHDEEFFEVYLNEDDKISLKSVKPNYDNKEFKEILLNLKKIYKINISGYYTVILNKIPNYGHILEFHKKEDEEFINNYLELKVVFKEYDEVCISFDDFEYLKLINPNLLIDLYFYEQQYYVCIKDIGDEDILDLLEYGELSYKNSFYKYDGKNLLSNQSIVELINKVC